MKATLNATLGPDLTAEQAEKIYAQGKEIAVKPAKVDDLAGVSREGRNDKRPRSHEFRFARLPTTVHLFQSIVLIGFADQIRTAGIPASVGIATVSLVSSTSFDSTLHAHDVHGATSGGIFQWQHVTIGRDNAARHIGLPTLRKKIK